MNMQWYTVKIKYNKEFDDGSIKRVNEPYLLQAATFTDAEARIHEEVLAYVRGEFLISNISKTEFADIFYYDDSDKWYKCKLQYVDINPDNGKEKKITQQYLVSASNVRETYDRLCESLKDMMTSFDIPSIVLSPIVDVIPFDDETQDRVVQQPAEPDEEQSETVESDDSRSSADESKESESYISDEYDQEDDE